MSNGVVTADDKYTILIRNLRRRINDTVSESPADGEQPPVVSNDDMKDEIDLAISYVDPELDITTLRREFYEVVILRVWIMFCKMLAFDSAKFFYMQQTSQTYNKGERTNHYLAVAKNLESIFDKTMERHGLEGSVCVGDVNILDRDTLTEDTLLADDPPADVQITGTEELSVAKGFNAGDYRITWEKTNEWDFQAYKLYKDTNANVDKDSPIVATVYYNYTTEYVINLPTPGDYYFCIYVLDNRDQYSKKSNIVKITVSTGSV